MVRLAIKMLGGLEIRLGDAGTPLELPTRKSMALLAYLALSPGGTRSREHLAGAFWARSADEQARASLRQTLSVLRKALAEPGIVNTDAHSVWLDTRAIDVDALQFERLAAQRTPDAWDKAASLYGGDFLDGFGLREEHFEEWMLIERRRYQALALQVHSDLLTHFAQTAQAERGIEAAERLLAMDPLQEWAHCALMRLYWRAGRREQALRQYRECVKVLEEELGIAPAKETRALASSIGRDASEPIVSPVERAAEEDSPVAAPAITQSRDEPPLADAARAPQLPTLPAERKQLTVLSATLHDDAAGADADAMRDPEAMLERLDPILDAMRDAVHRFGGTISLMRGDGITAFFGAPVAHEDHAVRACCAALAMRDSIRALATPAPDVRIGISSGEAVVRTIGDERARHYDAVGNVSQIASVIHSVLGPGEIAITAETSRRAEGFVEVSAPRARLLDGFREPVALHLLHSKSALRLRWEARSTRELTRFVGREPELSRLEVLLEIAGSGSGQVAAVVGDPGVGKSRLVHELVNSPRVAGWTVLETGTLSHESGATYYPFANLLRDWFEIGEHDVPAAAAAKLRDGIVAIDEALSPMLAPLLALLDLPVEGRQWSTLSPAHRRQRTLEAIKALMVRAGQMQPLLVVIEDLHWIDSGSQAVLDYLVEGLAASHVMLLVTHRPEYRHEWSPKSYFSQLRLNPLGTSSADELLRALLGDDPSLDALCRELIDRTEGTPLFLEESVRSLVETGALEGTSGGYRLVRPVESFRIPSTVQAVLAARIDRLSAQAKGLLQTAAVIGNDVPLDLLERIAGLEPQGLMNTLGALQSAELLYEIRLLPSREYSFKHALTHQVAYESVLRERRRAVHRQIVELIETLHASRLDEHVERLAHHALGGELWVEAVQYLLRSASRAMQRSAHQPAIGFLTKGLEIVRRLPESGERLRLELELQKAMGVAMMAARGWAASEVLDAYTRARALSEELGDCRELFIVLRGQGQYHMIRGESRIARELGERCIHLASGSEDPGVQIETHHLFWTNSFFMGDYADAGAHCDKGIELYQPERDHPLTYVYSGHDPGVCSRSFSALIRCLHGFADQSLDRCREAIVLAERLAHPLTTALAQWAFSYVHLLRREPEAARQWAQREIEICEEYLLPLLLSQGNFQLGWALTELGGLDEGIVRMREGLAAISATGAEMGLPYFSALLGEALGKAGRAKEGLEVIEAALQTANRNGARFQISEILRLKGELSLQSAKSGRAQAEACFREAMAAADEQGARLPGLRAAFSLARLLEESGRPAEAREVLSPAYRAIHEGLETADAREAAMLLESLGQA